MSDYADVQKKADQKQWFTNAWAGCLGVSIACLIMPFFKGVDYWSTFKDLFLHSALPFMCVIIIISVVGYIIMRVRHTRE